MEFGLAQTRRKGTRLAPSTVRVQELFGVGAIDQRKKGAEGVPFETRAYTAAKVDAYCKGTYSVALVNKFKQLPKELSNPVSDST